MEKKHALNSTYVSQIGNTTQIYLKAILSTD